MNTPNTQPWMTDASCTNVDPESFFPTAGGGGNTTKAVREICAACPVQTACLKYALADPDLYGIWAGTTEAERDNLRRGAA